jgi:hypothetical protein
VADSNLELAATDDLIEELYRRHRAVLVVASKPKKTDPEISLYGYWYSGSSVEACGLAHYAARAMLDQMREAPNYEE